MNWSTGTDAAALTRGIITNVWHDLRLLTSTAVVVSAHWLAWQATLPRHVTYQARALNGISAPRAMTLQLLASKDTRTPPIVAQQAQSQTSARTMVASVPPMPRNAPATPAPYIPASALTRAPHVLTPPELTFPLDMEPGHYAMVVTLYIDDIGLVQKVELSGDNIPLIVQDTVRQAFMQALFTPGQLDGTDVRSITAFEVVFDDAGAPPLPSPAP